MFSASASALEPNANQSSAHQSSRRGTGVILQRRDQLSGDLEEIVILLTSRNFFGSICCGLDGHQEGVRLDTTLRAIASKSVREISEN